MPALRSCERLRREHELIEQVLGGLDLLKRYGGGGSPVPEPPVSGAIEFFSAFVDRCHDRKEEEGLFPVLETRRMPGDDPFAALRSGHGEQRRLLETLRALSRHQRGRDDVLGPLDAYAEQLRRHIAVEDLVVLPFAERMLSPEDDARVEQSFDRIEARVLGADGPAVSLALAGAVTHACATMVAESTKVAAGTVARQLRTGDRAYRYGGDQLVVLLPEQTTDSARIAAERIREAVDGLSLPHAGNPPWHLLTVSAGVAAFRPGEAPTYDALLVRAEGALLRAKADGRNRVALAE